MSCAQIVIVADPKTAEPESGSFVRIWRDAESEVISPGDWLDPVLWNYQLRHKVGRILMPCNDNDDGELFHTLDLIAKMTYFLNGALSRQVTFFMTEADACILLPEMVTPQVPLDLLDESVTDVLLNLAVGRFCHSLKLPPFESNDGKVKRLK